MLFSGMMAPDGFVYAWKRRTIKNWEWEEQLKALAANGWRVVPGSRHGKNDDAIEVNGWVLMERRSD